MDKKQRTQLALFLAVTLAFVVLAISIGLTQGGQGQTITDPKAIPVKGIAKHERD